MDSNRQARSAKAHHAPVGLLQPHPFENRRAFAEELASMTNVGEDANFARAPDGACDPT